MPCLRVLKLLECNYSRQLSNSYIHKTGALFQKQAWESTHLAKTSISSDKQNPFLHANEETLQHSSCERQHCIWSTHSVLGNPVKAYQNISLFYSIFCAATIRDLTVL